MSDTPKTPVTQTDANRLADAIDTLSNHKYVRIHNSVWRMMFYQFLRGLAFGLGSLVGATILLSFVVYLLSQIEFVPIIGDWAGRIIEEIEAIDPDGR